MYNVIRATMSRCPLLGLALAVGVAAATPAAAQLLPPAESPTAGDAKLLAFEQDVPLIGVLDNPCTAEVEAIAFDGATHLVQEVWQLANGNLRLIVSEHTSVSGQNTLPLGPSGPRYAAYGPGKADLEFAAASVSLLSHKKVLSEGMDTNFHAVLVLDFDPSTLKLDLKLEGSCDNGLP
jgi:hypothetical protein